MQTGASFLAAKHVGAAGDAMQLSIGISQTNEDAMMTIVSKRSDPGSSDDQKPIIIDFRDILVVEIDENKGEHFRMMVASQSASTAPYGYLTFQVEGAAAKHCESWLAYLVGIRDFYHRK